MLPCPASELEKRSRSKSNVHAIVEPYKMDVFQTPTKDLKNGCIPMTKCMIRISVT